MTKKLCIKKIIAEGYDRWAYIQLLDNGFMAWVHFIEFDSYVDNHLSFGKIKVNDIIQGTLKIEYVNNYEFTNDDELFVQPINESSHLIAQATILEAIDEYTFLCHINSQLQNIIIEFENKAKLKAGDAIKFKASLELDVG